MVKEIFKKNLHSKFNVIDTVAISSIQLNPLIIQMINKIKINLIYSLTEKS